MVQHRHPLGRDSWELPSGTAEPQDADAEAVARRELAEETGLRAGRLAELGAVDMAPGTSRQACRVFVATELAIGVAAPLRDAKSLAALLVAGDTT